MSRKTRSASSKPARAKRSRPASKASLHKVVWRHATLRIRHTPDYLSKGWSHIELSVTSPKGAPLPITTTGYLSHFLDADHLAAAGGPVAFFVTWLDREAASKAWAKTELAWRQGDLFAEIDP